MSPVTRHQKPQVLSVHLLKAGDVVVYKPGDVRQVQYIHPVADGREYSIDWGDGRHSMLQGSRTFVRLHSVEPKAAPPINAPTINDTPEGSETS